MNWISIFAAGVSFSPPTVSERVTVIVVVPLAFTTTTGAFVGAASEPPCVPTTSDPAENVCPSESTSVTTTGVPGTVVKSKKSEASRSIV